MEPAVNKRLLITGLSGFTGRYLASRLTREGWEICGLGADCGDSYANLNVDLSETQRIADWIATQQPTHIAHLAAQSHVVGDPLRFYRDNLLGTESLLDAIVASAVVPQKILIASSANIYGNNPNSPIAEHQPYRPMNHYASSKVAMELLVRKWFDRYPIIITRPFNYTGPGQSESFLFPKLVGAFYRRQTHISLGNIDVARDLSDVNFVVEAYARLLQSAVQSNCFNICSGSSISIRKALALLTELTGHKPEIAVDPALVRPDEIAELRGDPARLQAAIGPLEPTFVEELFGKMLAAFKVQAL
jgi:GDP-6-deoxy-D-talose 4-dehydrogenase